MPEPHPLLMDDLIVEHQQDLLREASAGRRARTFWLADKPADRADGGVQPWPGLIPIIRRLAMTWAARWTVGILIGVSLVAAGQGAVEASTLDQNAKSIAENVLGRDTVKTARVSADATAVMRWEAATYRPQNSIAASRELLYDEASLVTGAILGSLRDVRRITFTMVRGEQVLATGEVSRSQDLVLRFVPQLGGGTHTKPESRPKPRMPSGGEGGSPL